MKKEGMEIGQSSLGPKKLLVSQHAGTGVKVYRQGSAITKRASARDPGDVFMEAFWATMLKNPGYLSADASLEYATPDGDIEVVLTMPAGIPLSATGVDKEVKLSLQEILMALGDSVCASLAAHEAGIIHRDIKPANIVLVENDSKSPTLMTSVLNVMGLRDELPKYHAKYIDFGQMANSDISVSSFHGTNGYYNTVDRKSMQNGINQDIFALLNTYRSVLGSNLIPLEATVPRTLVLTFLPFKNKHNVVPPLVIYKNEDSYLPVDRATLDKIDEASEGLYYTLTNMAEDMLRGREITLKHIARVVATQLGKKQVCDKNIGKEARKMAKRASQFGRDAPSHHDVFLRMTDLARNDKSRMSGMAKTLFDVNCKNNDRGFCFYDVARIFKAMAGDQEWEILEELAQAKPAMHDAAYQIRDYLLLGGEPWESINFEDSKTASASAILAAMVTLMLDKNLTYRNLLKMLYDTQRAESAPSKPRV